MADEAHEGETEIPDSRPPPGIFFRIFWIGLGLICVAIGSIGVIVPGLPTTIFMIAAAGCFARSSPRLEKWLLGLPGVGRVVTDYRVDWACL